MSLFVFYNLILIPIFLMACLKKTSGLSLIDYTEYRKVYNSFSRSINVK